MKYPAVWLMEEGAHGEVLSIAFAGEGQLLDAGAKMVHVAPARRRPSSPNRSPRAVGEPPTGAGPGGAGAEQARSFVRCDALILDEASRSDTYPYMEIEENDTQIGHEATVSKVGEDQLSI